MRVCVFTLSSGGVTTVVKQCKLSDLVNFCSFALQSPEIKESAGSPAKWEQWWLDSVQSWWHSIQSGGYAITVWRLHNNSLQRLGPIEEGNQLESNMASWCRLRQAGLNKAEQSEDKQRQ